MFTNFFPLISLIIATPCDFISMKKGDRIFSGTAAMPNEPGITVYHSQTSAAFMLIIFMVGDLLFVYKSLAPPVNLNIYNGFDEDNFNALKNKILKKQASGEFSHLNLTESIYLYMLLDVVCKCFVDDANETLKDLAINNVKISEEEYEIMRMNFLRYGQSLIGKMNEKFAANEIFRGALAKLKGDGTNT